MNFLQKIYKKSKEQKGFTLVEMIVVLVIIAILAAITIPALLKYIDKAREKQVVVNARTAYLAAETVVGEAYAASTDGKVADFTFTNTDKTSGSGNAKSASELTGIDKKYKCEVNIGADDKTIESITYTEEKNYAYMDVKNGGSWDVGTTSSGAFGS